MYDYLENLKKEIKRLLDYGFLQKVEEACMSVYWQRFEMQIMYHFYRQCVMFMPKPKGGLIAFFAPLKVEAYLKEYHQYDGSVSMIDFINTTFPAHANDIVDILVGDHRIHIDDPNLDLQIQSDKNKSLDSANIKGEQMTFDF